GLPDGVPAVTVNKVCGSGLKAVMLADQAIRAGDCEVVVAGGMESMSQAPHLLKNARGGWKFGNQAVLDAMVHDGLWCSTEDVGMGNLAEQTADSSKVSRSDQDAFAAESHRRALEAIEQGKFKDEIQPVNVVRRGATTVIDTDEGPRADTSAESLGKLAPAFLKEGSITAGNASQISDGAAAVVVANEELARESNLPIKAKIIASAASGVAPKDLFIAPVSAIQMVLAKARMTLDDIDLVELNEAFAAQCLACMRPLDLSNEKVNINGGAIALGHPIGASGTRVLVTLLHALADRGLKTGLAALCLGGGNAVAMIVERTG
ncbi:MAG: acetyl-CoA C-acyltransferase, partial [Planctomycetes bacterium]|nr:acetyl-CoA C-acyltransferase [Planctomycetota bacterium]